MEDIKNLTIRLKRSVHTRVKKKVVGSVYGNMQKLIEALLEEWLKNKI